MPDAVVNRQTRQFRAGAALSAAPLIVGISGASGVLDLFGIDAGIVTRWS